MSRLTGEQLFEIMGNLPDEFVTEALPLSLLGGAAGAPLYSLSAAGSGTAAKTGFGAWLAKGGWVALTAGALVAAGIAMGAFFLGRNGDTPAESGEVTAETVETTETSSPDETEKATSEASSETESESNTETETKSESETEADTREPAVLRLTDFSGVDLSLFGTDQCKVSVTDGGKLLVEADWAEGSSGGSQFTLAPHALMPYAPAYAESPSYTPGAIVMKIKRENVGNSSITVRFKGEGDTDFDAASLTATVQKDENTGYEYVLLCTDRLATYMDGSQPSMTMAWLSSGYSSGSPDGYSLTVEEMIFYPLSFTALTSYSDYLAENGMTSEIEYFSSQDYCIVTKSQLYTNIVLHIPSYNSDMLPVKAIEEVAYFRNTFLFALIAEEGLEYIRSGAFRACDNLTVAYLPDSLIYLGDHAFDACKSMTNVHLGSELRVIGHEALPLRYETFTDIYYNGTVADWYRIARWDTEAEHPITVHCTDGTVDYSDPAPADLPKQEEVRDLTDLLSKAPPMETKEGETVVSCEARVIRLKQGDYGSYREFVLRYGLLRKEDTERYSFDVLSLEDGSILATAPYESGMNRLYGAGGMFFLDTPPAGTYDAMVFLYDYGLATNGDLLYCTQYYGICYGEDGTVTITSAYHLSPGISESGRLIGRNPQNVLGANIPCLSALSRDLNNERYGSRGWYLTTTDPDGNTTVFTAAEAPAFDSAILSTLYDLPLADVLDRGLTAIHEQYGPKKES